MSLDPDRLHDYLCERARAGATVTESEVSARFGVEVGAVRKRFGLLTGAVVLEETGVPGEYRCGHVLRCTKAAFESAGSQGKGNQEYVRGLLAEIARLNKNNETLRAKLLAAHGELEKRGVDPSLLA
jgi:hypothetical protein